MKPNRLSHLDSRAGLGSLVSVAQSALFVVIALSALAMGIDRFVHGGLAALSSEAPGLFLVLCGAFILIAVLGLGATALIVGPAWHLWIARLFPRNYAQAEARHD